MCAVKTSLKNIDIESLKKIMQGIRETIPVGFSHHLKNQDKAWMPQQLPPLAFLDNFYEPALKQIGTLGGGNHFIEIQKGSDGFIWLMIHSGSRNVGFQVAKYYNNIAVELNEKWFSQVPKEWELASLPLDSQEGQNYLSEMAYCVNFALSSRSLMMHRVEDAVSIVCGDVSFDERINIAHNYAQMEHHFGTNVMVHRKGATKAYANQLGVIPGSQGTSSYIVEGLGNPDSFMSCSHGAGRKMGRKQAERELDFDTEKKRLDDLGIIHSVRQKSDLDEAPGAYKDILMVMENQKDLVKIVVELKPLAVIKG